MEFKEKKYLITGGSSGIGLSVAEQIVSNGGIAILFARDLEKLNKAKDFLGDNSRVFQGDVSNLDDIDRLYAYLEKEFAMIDGLVVNASVVKHSSIQEVTEDFFDNIMSINLKGAFFTAQKGIDFLKPNSSIVFTSSVAANIPFENNVVYSASKSALSIINKCFALELVHKKIRVNIVNPGFTLTPIFDPVFTSYEGAHEKEKQRRESLIPMNRFADPGEVANVIMFLLSEKSSYITGSEIDVDGGLSNLNIKFKTNV